MLSLLSSDSRSSNTINTIQHKGNFETTFSHFSFRIDIKMISFVWLFLDEIVDDISVRRRLCGHFCATAELQSKNVHSGGPFQLLRQSQLVDQLLPRFVSYRCFDVAGKIKLLNYFFITFIDLIDGMTFWIEATGREQ